ncbi:hypothetical protein DRN63_03750 [Nanoarchaeota archaeon]|nr:MAG: hypothetical protein DRN63_03750 [Nanoarchaeota archaeon]
MLAAGQDLDEVINWVEQHLKRSIGITPLYERQKEALHELLGKFYSESRIRGVFQMPTGAGKTIVAAGLILALFKLGSLRWKDIILYLTPRTALRGQVEDKFKKIFETLEKDRYGGMYRIKIFDVENLNEKRDKQLGIKGVVRRLSHYLNVWQGNPILILIVTPDGIHELLKKYNSLSELRNANRIRMVFLDEVHRAYFGPEFFKSIKKLIDGLPCVGTVMIGLSATPIRQAVEEIGPPLYRLSSQDAMEEGILVKRLKIYPMNTRTRLLERFDKDEWEVAVIERAEKYSEKILEKLSQELRELYINLPTNVNPLSKRVLKTLVVAANTTEANEIAKNLRRRLAKLRPNDNLSELVRVAHYKVTEALDELNKFREQDEGILVTVNMADIGFDDPNLEALVIARPISTPIAYVQIRGRVLRRPKKQDNLKALKYAILIDLTGSSKYEASVSRVELAEFPVKDFDALKRELEGIDEVPKVHGDVELEEYEPFEVPRAPPPSKPSISVEELKKEILITLRLGHSLSTKLILNKLSERGIEANLDKVERICHDLVKEGKLEQQSGKWFYPYDIRIKDILQTNEDKIWSISELIKEAGIPSVKREEVESILKEIIKEVLTNQGESCSLSSLTESVKIIPKELIELIPKNLLDKVKIALVIAPKTKRNVTLGELNGILNDMLRRRVDWIIVRYPLRFEGMISNKIKRLGGIVYYALDKRKLENGWMGEMLLLKWL